MTGEEVKKYINQVAFSGAKEFMSQYEGQMEGKGIIGNFGLGFYSAFMVSDKVEVHSKSFKDGEGTEAVKWECEGDPEYKLTKSKKKTAERKLFFTSTRNQMNSSKKRVFKKF